MSSRQVTERVVLGFFPHAVGHALVTPAPPKIGIHLLVPLVIFPAVEPLCQPSALRQRQLLNRLLNLLNCAHADTLPTNASIFKYTRTHVAWQVITQSMTRSYYE